MSAGTRPDQLRFATLLVVAVAVVYAAPLFSGSYFPGLDIPWHAAAAEVLHARDPFRFLGYFEVDRQFPSYLTVYYAVDAIAFVARDTALAMQIVVALYVAAFVLGARSLIRSFGGSGVLAVLAAPAALSIVMEFGFITYAVTYPLVFFLWASVRRASQRPTALRAVAIALLMAAVSISHPFAAFVGAGGAGLIVLVEARRETIGGCAGVAAAVALGLLPAVYALVAIGPGHGVPVPPEIASADLWTRMSYQVFNGLDVSLAAAPARTFGHIPVIARFALFGVGLSAAVIARHVAGLKLPPVAGARATAGLLLFAMVAIYLLTPETFYWPRFWYMVQPRHLPIIWVLALCVLRVDDRAPHLRRAAAVAMPVTAAALVVWIATAWLPFSRESQDFRAVVTASRPEAKTLALIEQPQARDREPAGPFRNFGAHLLALRGGYVSHLPMATGYTGILTPVNRAPDSPPLLPQTHPGTPRTFDWDTHAAPWDQFLIRDLDANARFDYFRDHASEVELIAQQGRWRLYERTPR